MHATTSIFTPPVDEQVRDLERVLQDLVGRLRPVREPAGVAEVERRLVREEIDERAQHREPTEPGVEDSDRPLVDRGRPPAPPSRITLVGRRGPTEPIRDGEPDARRRGRHREHDVEPENIGLPERRVEDAGVLVRVGRCGQRHGPRWQLDAASRAPRARRRAPRRRRSSPARATSVAARDDLDPRARRVVRRERAGRARRAHRPAARRRAARGAARR